MADYSVLSKVMIQGTVVEKVENEAVGVRYKVKIKSNDKLEYLWFEEDEIVGGSTTPIIPTTNTNPEEP